MRKLDGSLLFEVSRDGSGDIKKLISMGANVNIKDIDGDTPLHYASKNLNKEAVFLLIAAGANVNAKNKSKRTPLHIGSLVGNCEIVTALIAAGTDINSKDISGDTALHTAAFLFKVQTILTLMSDGADPHVKNNEGNNPLDFTFRWGHKPASLALISYGASTSKIHKGAERLGCLSMPQAAAQGGFTERVIELLQEHKPDVQGNKPTALAALAIKHGHHNTAAAIQSFMANKAIESMLRGADKIWPSSKA